VRALSQPLDAGGNSENNGSVINAAIESQFCSPAHKKASKKKPPASSEEVVSGGGAAALPVCRELILRGIKLWQVAPLLGVSADVPAKCNENMVLTGLSCVDKSSLCYLGLFCSFVCYRPLS
jgi:hypothetical protein